MESWNFFQSTPVIGAKFKYAHANKTYLSYLLCDTNGDTNKYKIKRAKVACPVDVEIYSPTGEILGKITDNKIDEIYFAFINRFFFPLLGIPYYTILCFAYINQDARHLTTFECHRFIHPLFNLVSYGLWWASHTFCKFTNTNPFGLFFHRLYYSLELSNTSLLSCSCNAAISSCIISSSLFASNNTRSSMFTV